MTEQIVNELRQRYAEPQRHYHNLAHVEHCLREMEQVRGMLADPAAAEAAIWFHDCVYDPKAKDNEEQSARVAERMLDGEPDLAQKVAELVLATQHAGVPADADAQYLCDIDLAILGASSEEFDRYCEAIRREYAFVADADYRRGRTGVLRGFLARDRIYVTEHFFRKYEGRARENLAREMERLAPVGE